MLSTLIKPHRAPKPNKNFLLAWTPRSNRARVIATPWTAAAWRRFGCTRLIRERRLEGFQRDLLRPVQPKRGHVPAVQITAFLAPRLTNRAWQISLCANECLAFARFHRTGSTSIREDP